MNFTWETVSDFITKALEFIKQLLSSMGEWPLDLGIKKDAE